MRKTAIMGVGVTLTRPCCNGFQSSGANISFEFVFYLALLEAAFARM